MRFPIVGQKHRGFHWALPGIVPGTAVVLIREPDNPYDKNAVAVWIGSDHVGYIPAHANAELARYIESYGRASTQKGLALDATFGRSSTAYPEIEVDIASR